MIKVVINLDIRAILPLISILSFGYVEVIIIRKVLKIDEKKSFFDILLSSIILGTLTLVSPMILFGVLSYHNPQSKLLSAAMSTFCYSYFAISMAIILYYLFIFIRKRLPNYFLENKGKFVATLNKLWILIAILMLGGYTFQAIIYPIRGWDALHFYLPNAFKIFATGQLAKINELNFMPQFKPPMNVMLYAYTFFITLTEMIQLVPMLYFYGTVYLIYKIAKLEGFNDRYSIMATIAFLATPFVYLLIYEYQYYQELYILFFTSASYYYYRSFLLTEKMNKKWYYVILASFSFSGAILSKISGFIIPVIIFVAMPSDRIGKITRIILVVGFSIQLIRKSLSDIYIGTAIFILLIAIVLIYFIIKSNNLDFSLTRWAMIGTMFILPAIVGLLWLKHMLSIGGIDSFLRQTYLDTNTSKIMLKWSGILLPDTNTYLENAQAATFTTSTFTILIATVFAGSWAIIKLIGFYGEIKKKNYSLIIWLLFFYSFWQALFAQSSVRYLAPIVIPLTLIFVSGFQTVVQYFNKLDNYNRDGFFSFMFLVTTAYLSLYPVLPIEAAFQTQFHIRWFIAHSHVFSLILQIVFWNLIIFSFIWLEKRWKLSYDLIYKTKKRFTKRKSVVVFIIFILVIVPSIAQIALLTYYRFSISKFYENYVYFSRSSYNELKYAINNLGLPDYEVILSVNTPGLEYYVSQPVMDLMMFSEIDDQRLIDKIPLTDQNITKLLNFFKSYNVTMFISINPGNDWYKSFMAEYYNKYYLYRLLGNNLLFTLQFSNSEYSLYTLNSNIHQPYVGPVDFLLTNGHNSASLYSHNFHGVNISENEQEYATVEAVMDFSAIDTDLPFNVSISTNYSTYLNYKEMNTTKTYYYLDKPSKDNFQHFSLLSLNDSSCVIYSITIDIYFHDTISGQIDIYEYLITSSSTDGLIIHKYQDYWYTYAINGLIFSNKV